MIRDKHTATRLDHAFSLPPSLREVSPSLRGDEGSFLRIRDRQRGRSKLLPYEFDCIRIVRLYALNTSLSCHEKTGHRNCGGRKTVIRLF